MKSNFSPKDYSITTGLAIEIYFIYVTYTFTRMGMPNVECDVHGPVRRTKRVTGAVNIAKVCAFILF